MLSSAFAWFKRVRAAFRDSFFFFFFLVRVILGVKSIAAILELTMDRCFQISPFKKTGALFLSFYIINHILHNYIRSHAHCENSDFAFQFLLFG